MRKKEPAGIIYNIQNYCIHDGPGIRTTVFLKGCSCRCKWCSNPESISPKPELAYDLARCIGKKECGLCLRACPESAVIMDGSDEKARVNRSLCNSCLRCVDACPAKALHAFGIEMTVDKVLEHVEREGSFFRQSGGGMTLSGGDPLLQPDFSAALLAEARRRGINTAIETAGNVPWTAMKKVLPHVDIVIHDHKVSDPERYKKWVGAANIRILRNYKKAYEAFPEKIFVATTPLIPGVNDGEAHVRAVLDFIRPYRNVIKFELLPYHRFGENKYGFLGKEYELKDLSPPPQETIRLLREIIDRAFNDEGLPVHAGNAAGR